MTGIPPFLDRGCAGTSAGSTIHKVEIRDPHPMPIVATLVPLAAGKRLNLGFGVEVFDGT